MKKFTLIFVLALIGLSLLITSCSGGISVNAWPSVTPGEDVVYLASGYYIYRKPIKSDTAKYWFYPTTTDSAKVFFSAPAVSEDLVVAGSWYSGKDGKYGLYGITMNGAEAWSTPFLEAKGRWIASPAICGDRIYAPNMDQNIYILDTHGSRLSTYGKESYAADVNQDVDKVNMGSFWAQPVCDEENVYISNLNHYLLAFKQGDALQFLWRADIKAALVASPAILPDGNLVIGNINGGLYVINSRNGDIVHSVELDGGIWSKPTIAGDAIYVGTQAGSVYKLNTDLVIQSGSPYILGGAVTGGGAVAEDGVYFGTDAGLIFKIGTNDEVTQVPTGASGKYYSDPVIVNNTLIFPITGGGTTLMFLLNLSNNEPDTFTPAQ